MLYVFEEGVHIRDTFIYSRITRCLEKVKKVKFVVYSSMRNPNSYLNHQEKNP